MEDIYFNLGLTSHKSEILRTKATDWDFSVDGDPQKLIDKMNHIMKWEGGTGLAAPQVGISRRMFIMTNDNEPFAFFNPKIVDLSGGIETKEEGCLSFRGLFLKIPRYKSVRIRAADRFGEVSTSVFNGLSARVIQTNVDLLNGIINDKHKLSRLKYNILERKYYKSLGIKK